MRELKWLDAAGTAARYSVRHVGGGIPAPTSIFYKVRGP